MANITFKLAEDNITVEACIYDFASPIPTEEDFRLQFESSEFGECLVLEDGFAQLLNALPEGDTEAKEGTPQEETPLPLEEPLVFKIARKLDASLTINITADEMQASAHLITAQGGDNFDQEMIFNQLKEEVANQLKTENDIKGLKNGAIEQLYNESLSAGPGAKINTVLAEGVPPEEGTPTIFEYLVTPLQDRILVPQEREDGSVDMHDLGEIEVVKEGDELVRRIPSKAGANGYNIAGEVLFSVAPPNLPLVAGEGAQISETDPDLLVASRDGVPLKIDNGMLVSDVLVLDKVNLAVGNIDFDGTVIVKGDVDQKMQVKATHDVVVKGFAESCTIEAGGNITVSQGVIGREQSTNTKEINLDQLTARLVAGGEINVRYAQASYLEAKGDILVSSQLLHCHAIAGESLLVGRQGQKTSKLVGGKIQAAKVGAGEIGAPANSRIIIDFSDKIKALEKQLRELMVEKSDKEEFKNKLASALKKLEIRASTPEIEAHCEKTVKTINHVAEEIQQMEEAGLAIESQIESIRKAIHADVYGRIYPNVEFVICDESYRTRNEVPTCVVRFRKRQMLYDGANEKLVG